MCVSGAATWVLGRRPKLTSLDQAVLGDGHSDSGQQCSGEWRVCSRLSIFRRTAGDTSAQTRRNKATATPNCLQSAPLTSRRDNTHTVQAILACERTQALREPHITSYQPAQPVAASRHESGSAVASGGVAASSALVSTLLPTQ